MLLDSQESTKPVPPFDISVIIAAYKCTDTLERAVTSALDQPGVNVEVIIVDDASPDGTLRLAKELEKRHENVIAMTTGRNRGPAAARNLALYHAQGEYVTILDSDDFMARGRLASLLKQARSLHATFLADDLYKVEEGNENGPPVRLLQLPEVGTESFSVDLTEFVRGNMTTYNGARGEMGFLKPLIERDFLEKHNLRYHEDMRLGEDFALYAEALLAGARFSIVGPAGYFAVVRPESLSGSHSVADLRALSYRIKELRDGTKGAARTALQALWIDTMKRYSWARLIDAVKAHDLSEIAVCFKVPTSVFVYLIRCLVEQFVLRTLRLFGRKV